MGIEIKNQDTVIKLLKSELEGLEKNFEQALLEAKAEIDKRTTSGKDVSGKSFDDYTPEYKAYKAKKGRRTSPVDLTFSGSMLRAMTTEVKRQGNKLVGKIFFNSAREAAKAAGNMRLRDFFGLSDEQVQRIRNRLISK